jgi:hypothetical protein
MRNYKLLIAAALIVTSAGAYLSHTQERNAATNPQQSRTIFLEGYLLELGEKYDLYFTLETAWAEGEFSNWMENHKVKEPPKLDGIQRELERLSKSVPHFTYAFDPTNPKVVHISDARLAQQNDYGLNGVVKSIDYKGTLARLVTALGERGIKVSAGSLSLIGDTRPRDHDTEVHVAAQKINVRDAITHFIPLEGRRRIIWSSTTKLGTGEVSHIVFYGSVRKQ